MAHGVLRSAWKNGDNFTKDMAFEWVLYIQVGSSTVFSHINSIRVVIGEDQVTGTCGELDCTAPGKA